MPYMPAKESFHGEPRGTPDFPKATLVGKCEKEGVRNMKWVDLMQSNEFASRGVNQEWWECKGEIDVDKFGFHSLI